MVVWWLATVSVALLLGVAIGTRRERGTWQRVRRVEETQREQQKARRGVRLHSISVRR